MRDYRVTLQSSFACSGGDSRLLKIGNALRVQFQHRSHARSSEWFKRVVRQIGTGPEFSAQSASTPRIGRHPEREGRGFEVSLAEVRRA